MDGESHDCLTKQILTSWPDLQNVPLLNPDLIISVSGSCLQDATGKLVSSYAVYTVHGTLEGFALPSLSSARVADLVDLSVPVFWIRVNLQPSTLTLAMSLVLYVILVSFGITGFPTCTGSPIKSNCYVMLFYKPFFYPLLYLLLHVRLTQFQLG